MTSGANIPQLRQAAAVVKTLRPNLDDRAQRRSGTMTETLDNYRDTLAEIGRLAEQAVNGMVDVPDTKFDHATEAQSCTVRSLPPRLRQKAAEVAVTINPLNAPVLGAMMGAAEIPLEPMHLTLLTSKY